MYKIKYAWSPHTCTMEVWVLVTLHNFLWTLAKKFYYNKFYYNKLTIVINFFSVICSHFKLCFETDKCNEIALKNIVKWCYFYQNKHVNVFGALLVYLHACTCIV